MHCKIVKALPVAKDMHHTSGTLNSLVGLLGNTSRDERRWECQRRRSG